MPNAPLKPCADRLCPELVPRGTARCDKHKTEHYRRQEASRPRDRQKRFGRLWQKKRAIVLAEEPLCQVCRRAAATECDHIVPVADGGTDARSNLRGLCKACHSRKTAAEVLN